jgi:hypothetical protein
MSQAACAVCLSKKDENPDQLRQPHTPPAVQQQRIIENPVRCVKFFIQQR